MNFSYDIALRSTNGTITTFYHFDLTVCGKPRACIVLSFPMFYRRGESKGLGGVEADKFITSTITIFDPIAVGVNFQDYGTIREVSPRRRIRLPHLDSSECSAFCPLGRALNLSYPFTAALTRPVWGRTWTTFLSHESGTRMYNYV